MNTAGNTADFARLVSAYLQCASETTAGIANLATRIDRVGDDSLRVPASVSEYACHNAWVCSPHTTYVSYAIEEARRLLPLPLALPVTLACRGIGALLRRARIDETVTVNNWLLSTNLYPSIDVCIAARWIDEAVGRWPTHAVWFRSLNRRHNAALIDALVRAGCLLVPSRQVYLFDSVDPSGRSHANLRRDLKLLAAHSFVSSPCEQWSKDDYLRAQELYEALYIGKYSQLNPRYTAQFLVAWARCGLLELTGFRDQAGVLQAIVGTFSCFGTISAPIVGYNTAMPQKLGLYRILMASVFRLAAGTGRSINLSAGAAGFKRLRGGMAEIEYSAVFARHLPAGRRAALASLAAITTQLGEPIMKRYRL